MITVNDVLEILPQLPADGMNPRSDDGQACVYTSSDGRHCIAGEILFRLGVELPHVEAYENRSAISELLQQLPIDADREVYILMGILQSNADAQTKTGITNPKGWGECVVDGLAEWEDIK